MNKRKKICYVLPRYNRSDASHFSHIHDFLKTVSIQRDLFLIIEKGEIPSDKSYYRHISLINSNGFSRLIKTFLYLSKARLLGYKNVYVHYSFVSALIASVIFRLTGGKVFYWNCGEPWKYSRTFIRNNLETLTYRLVSRFITGTQSLGNEYARRYAFSVNKVRVMPNWIDASRFIQVERKVARSELALSQDAHIVLFVHRLSNRKGANLIIPIAEKVLKQHPDAIFLVIGSGPEENALDFEIQQKHLEKNIILLGQKPNTLVPRYMSASDVFLMPSEEEGFPRVLLECMCLSLPFVASNVGSVLEIVPQKYKDFVIPYGDVDLFAKKISDIISMTSDERGVMSRVFLRHVEQYKISLVVDRFFQLFD